MMMHVLQHRRRRPAKWGHYRLSYTLSKSMNNVGENFFSSPIDPFDISKDWGRSDNDQRHRLVVSGAIDSRVFQFNTMLQAYSAPPFNITSGVTTVQGTTGRRVVDGAFIPRNAGTGSAFFSLSARLRRAFPIGGGRQMEGAVEAFNLTNRRNDLTRNGNFGSAAYPSSPSASFRQILGVGDPRTLQLALRVRF